MKNKKPLLILSLSFFIVTSLVAKEINCSKDDIVSPLMIFGEEKKPTTRNSLAEQNQKESIVDSSVEISRIMEEHPEETEEYQRRLMEEIKKIQDYANEDLAAEEKFQNSLEEVVKKNSSLKKETLAEPNELERRVNSKIIKADTAGMLSVFVGEKKEKPLLSVMTEPMREFQNHPLWPAAVWEGAVKESKSFTDSYHENLLKQQAGLSQKIEQLHNNAQDSLKALQAAEDHKNSAYHNLRSQAANTGSAAISAATGNPGPLVFQTASTIVAGVATTLAQMELYRTQGDVEEAKITLAHASESLPRLENFRKQVKELSDTLLPIEAAAVSLMETQLAHDSDEGRRIRNEVKNSTKTLMKQVQELLTWSEEHLERMMSLKPDQEIVATAKKAAFDQADRSYKNAPLGNSDKQKADKKATEAAWNEVKTASEKLNRSIVVAKSYTKSAQDILEALQSRDHLIREKEIANSNLEEAKRHKNSLERELTRVQEEYNEIKKEWKDTSTVEVMLHPQKKQTKDSAKAKLIESEKALEEARKALTQAENHLQEKTKQLEDADHLLAVWNHFKACHIGAIAPLVQLALGEKAAPILSLKNPADITSGVATPTTSNVAQPTLKKEIEPVTQQRESESAVKKEMEKKEGEIVSPDLATMGYNSDLIAQETQSYQETIYRYEVADRTREMTNDKFAAYQAEKSGKTSSTPSQKTPSALIDELDQPKQEVLDDIEFVHRLEVSDNLDEMARQKLASYYAKKNEGESGKGSLPPSSSSSSTSSKAPLDPDANAQKAIETGYHVDVARTKYQQLQETIANYRAQQESIISPVSGKTSSSSTPATPASAVSTLAGAEELPSPDNVAQRAIEVSHTIDVANKVRNDKDAAMRAWLAKRNKK